VVGEITAQHLLLVLNKVDLLPPEHREKGIRKAQKRLKEALASTKFAKAPIVAVSARPGELGRERDGEDVTSVCRGREGRRGKGTGNLRGKGRSEVARDIVGHASQLFSQVRGSVERKKVLRCSRRVVFWSF
jgi:hypothetical protein